MRCPLCHEVSQLAQRQNRTDELVAWPRDAARHKGRERLAWFLVGAVALLAAILAVPASNFRRE